MNGGGRLNGITVSASAGGEGVRKEPGAEEARVKSTPNTLAPKSQRGAREHAHPRS